METFLRDICLKHAPLRTMRVRGSQPGWMSDQIRSMRKERDKMKRKACKSKLDLDWTSYKQLRNSVTREIALAKQDYFNNLLKTQAQDASKLWSSIRKLIPKKSKVAVLDEKTFTGSLDIANCFNKFFTSVGSRLRSLLPTLNVSSYCDRLILTPRDTPDFVFKDIPVRSERIVIAVCQQIFCSQGHSLAHTQTWFQCSSRSTYPHF